MTESQRKPRQLRLRPEDIEEIAAHELLRWRRENPGEEPRPMQVRVTLNDQGGLHVETNPVEDKSQT